MDMNFQSSSKITFFDEESKNLTKKISKSRKGIKKLKVKKEIRYLHKFNE